MHMESCQPGKLTQNWCPELLLGLHYALLCWLTWSLQPLQKIGLTPIIFSSSGCQNWYCMASIISHIVRCPVAKSSRQTKAVLRCEGFQCPRDHPPVAEGKNQTSLWVKLILYYTDCQGLLSHFLHPDVQNTSLVAGALMVIIMRMKPHPRAVRMASERTSVGIWLLDVAEVITTMDSLIKLFHTREKWKSTWLRPFIFTFFSLTIIKHNLSQNYIFSTFYFLALKMSLFKTKVSKIVWDIRFQISVSKYTLLRIILIAYRKPFHLENQGTFHS